MRQLPALRTLSIKENPYCEAEEDWRGFIMALLPSTLQRFGMGLGQSKALASSLYITDLVFLECHAIKAEEREEASVRHQGDIFRAQNQVCT